MAISITKPVVNGSNNTWGDQINTALDTIVDAVNGVVGDAGEVVGTSLALDNADGDWTFEVASNKLVIKYGGVAKLEIDTSGNLTAVGDVDTNGTIS